MKSILCRWSTLGPVMVLAGSLGCADKKSASDRVPAAYRLCGLPFEDAHEATLTREDGRPLVRISGRIGSFTIGNMDSDQPRTCTFDVSGEHVGPESTFFRYGPRDEGRVRVERISPGRLRVTYPIPGRSYALVSIEPRVEAPADPVRFWASGVDFRIAEGALLRHEKGIPRLRSLGPATLVEMENPGDEPRAVRFVLDNTSDRLSEPDLQGLDQGSVERVHKLVLRVSGRIGPGGRARLALRPRELRHPWSFAIGGDIKQELGVFLQLMEQVRLKTDPLFLLATGDYTRNSLPHELDEYFRRTASLPFPVYPIKANHELRVQGEQHYPRMFGPDRYAFQVGEVLFAVLDSSRYDTGVHPTGFVVGDEQFAWLERVLGDHREAPWKMLALHCSPHPLHGSSLRPDYPMNLAPADAKRIQDLAAEHSLSHVLSGHAHLYARGMERGTVYLTSGGGGARLYSHETVPGFTIRKEKHIVVFHVGLGGIEEQVITLPRPVKP